MPEPRDFLAASRDFWAPFRTPRTIAGRKPKPAPSTLPIWLTPRTQAIMAGTPYQEQMAWLKQLQASGGDIEGMPLSPLAKAQQALDKVGGGITVNKPLTADEATNMLNQYYGGVGNGYRTNFNPATGGWEIGLDPYFQSLKTYPQYDTSPYDDPLTTAVEGRWNKYKGEWEPDTGLTLKEQRMAEGRAETARERGREWEAAREDRRLAQEYQIEQQRMAQSQAQFKAQLEAQHQQRLAQLAAQPMSWLQYAAESGTQPVVQPWMLPLMPQQYSQLQAGSAIPGYQGGAPSQPYTTVNTGLQGNPLTGGLQMGWAYAPPSTPGAISMTGMPQLTTPSRQYQARMGPTAGAQYAGYEQARSGATPEELQWRMWSQAPPSGRFSRLAWSR